MQKKIDMKMPRPKVKEIYPKICIEEKVPAKTMNMLKKSDKIKTSIFNPHKFKC